MPFKSTKQDSAEALVLEWNMHIKNIKLTLDKQRCVGCEICAAACPKAAITLTKQPKTRGKAAKKPQVDIDQAKCNFCGVCDVFCPYGAVKVTVNGTHDLNVLAKESYPQLTRDITVNAAKCDKECTTCETACPLNLIKISKVGYDGKPVSDISKLSLTGKRRVQVTVDIAKQYCPTCRVCEYKCGPGAVIVKKAYEGKIAIKPQKCPASCHDCVDVCPISGTLTVGSNGKVHVNDQTCTYCGACKNVCPEPKALTLERTKVLHTQVHSGAWNRTLERITSPENSVKEFTAQATQIRRKIVDKRFIVEEMKKNERARSN